MTEVLVATITSSGVVLAALLPLLVSARRRAHRAEQNSAAALEQVANSHTTNLRDDLDGKHADNTSRLGRVEQLAMSTARSVHRIERHLGIEESTQPRNQVPRRKK